MNTDKPTFTKQKSKLSWVDQELRTKTKQCRIPSLLSAVGPQTKKHIQAVAGQ